MRLPWKSFATSGCEATIEIGAWITSPEGRVVTGGTALMPGMVELAEDIFLKPVRLGLPGYAGGLADVVRNPRFATAVGLLEEARAQRLRGRKAAEQSGNFKETMRRMKDWFVGNF